MGKRQQKNEQKETGGQNFFSPVQQESVSQIIENQLKESIIRRHYRAGDKLPSETDLANMFATSRSSIRSAIRSLQRAGFVDIKKGAQGGAFVIQKGDSQLMVNDIRDVLRLRKVSLEEVLQARLSIEPEVAALAAMKATSRDIALLEEMTRNQRDGFDSGNPVMLYDRDPRFHRVIAEISGNQVFIIIMQILMEIHAYRMNQFRMNTDAIFKITGQHEGIIKALRHQDSRMAYKKMKEHVLAVHNLHKALEAE